MQNTKKQPAFTSTKPKESETPSFSKSSLMLRHWQPAFRHRAQSSAYMDLLDAITSWILLIYTIFLQHFLHLMARLLIE